MRHGTRGVERQDRAVRRTETAVGGENPFHHGDRRRRGEQSGRAGLEPRVQGPQGGRRRQLLPALLDLLDGHHARPPSSAHFTGKIVAPAPRAAATAPSTSSPATKNIDPPAPAPAAFPPSTPAAAIACSSRAIAGVRIPSSRSNCLSQFRLKIPPTRDRSPVRRASAISPARSLSALSAPVTFGSPFS